MKKGVIYLIPVVVLATVISIGTIGLVGTIRTQTINRSNVLSSSVENKGQGQTKSQGSSQSQFGKPTTTETSNKTNEQTKTGGLESKSKVGLEVQEATGEASPSVKPGRKIRTNFPITVNPLTNEKTVTTPGGIKVIILPEVAIQNMIRAGFPVVLPPEPSPIPSSSPEATPSATPEGTPSGTPEATTSALVDESGILLTQVGGQLVYEIPSIKQQKFLGLVSVKIKVKGYVSAENGEIVKLQKSLFDNVLDFLSF